LIIVASDGLWDNLEVEDVVAVVNTYTDKYQTINTSQLSQLIAEFAEKMSLKKDYFSPFAKRAFMSGRRFIGGKQDDITVVIGEISKSENDKE